jgi:hypothetical protein
MAVHHPLSNLGKDKTQATSEWRVNERHEGIEPPVALESNVLEDHLALSGFKRRARSANICSALISVLITNFAIRKPSK